MSKIKHGQFIHDGKKIRRDQFLYFCLGCNEEHAFGLKSEGGNHDFNMDLNDPTVSPSLLNDFVPGQRCHSYIRHGMIIYLSDCDHHLAGRTIELPDYEIEMEKLRTKLQSEKGK